MRNWPQLKGSDNWFFSGFVFVSFIAVLFYEKIDSKYSLLYLLSLVAFMFVVFYSYKIYKKKSNKRK